MIRRGSAMDGFLNSSCFTQTRFKLGWNHRNEPCWSSCSRKICPTYQDQQTTRLYPANLFSASHRPLIYQIPTMSGPILEGNPILPCLSCMPLWPPQNVWLELYKWMVFDDFSLKFQKHRRLSVKDHVFGLTRLFSASFAPLLSAPVIFLPQFFPLIHLIPNPPKRRLKPHYLENHPT